MSRFIKQRGNARSDTRENSRKISARIILPAHVPALTEQQRQHIRIFAYHRPSRHRGSISITTSPEQGQASDNIRTIYFRITRRQADMINKSARDGNVRGAIGGLSCSDIAATIRIARIGRIDATFNPTRKNGSKRRSPEATDEGNTARLQSAGRCIRPHAAAA